MKKRIQSIAINQTSRIIALVYFVLMALIFVPLGVMAAFEQSVSAGLAFIALPFIYGFAIYLLSLVGCWVYNKLAPHIGGIEVTLSDE